MLETWVAVVLANFCLVMILGAAFFMLVNRLVVGHQVSTAEIVFRWLVLFGLGFTGLYTFVMHAFYPALTAAQIGWPTSPFQYEVAMADLAFGVLGVLAFHARDGFRLATVIGAAIWLWGDAAGHLYQWVVFQNGMSGNAGSWLWMDLFVPLVLIICIIKMRRAR